jgi:hypothetical protein
LVLWYCTDLAVKYIEALELALSAIGWRYESTACQTPFSSLLDLLRKIDLDGTLAVLGWLGPNESNKCLTRFDGTGETAAHLLQAGTISSSDILDDRTGSDAVEAEAVKDGASKA